MPVEHCVDACTLVILLYYCTYNQSNIMYCHCVTVEQSCRLLMAPREPISYAERHVATTDAEEQLEPTA
jgi:hypothetical protein